MEVGLEGQESKAEPAADEVKETQDDARKASKVLQKPSFFDREQDTYPAYCCPTYRVMAICCMLVYLILNVLALAYFTYVLKKGERVGFFIKLFAGDDEKSKGIILGINQGTAIVNAVCTLCAVVAISLGNAGLLLPWLIFTWLECLHYVTLLIFALSSDQYLNAGLCLGYLITLVLFYCIVWKYYMLVQIRNKQREEAQGDIVDVP